MFGAPDLVPGERIVLTFVIAAIPDRDAASIRLPAAANDGPRTLLDDDLDEAIEAARAAAIAVLSARRTIVTVETVASRTPDAGRRPAAEPSEF
jgi:hypothetical protein